MKLLAPLFGAAVGGTVGAAIWAALVYFTLREFPYVAVAVGLLTGLGASLGAGRRADMKSGVTAVIVAILAVAAGKYFAIQALVRNPSQALMNFQGSGTEGEDSPETVAQQQIAADIAFLREEAGETLEWPLDTTLSNAWRLEDYPPDVQAQAQSTWFSLSDAERAKRLDEPPLGAMGTVARMANEAIEEAELRGETVRWPEGVDPEEAWTKDEFPLAFWEAASKKYRAMTEPERAAELARIDAEDERQWRLLSLATNIAFWREEEGQRIAWPANINLWSAYSLRHFPEDIRQEAEVQLASKGNEARADAEDEHVSAFMLSDPQLVVRLANDACEASRAADGAFTMPRGIEPGEGDQRRDFPPEIWAASVAKLKALSTEEKEAFKKQVADELKTDLNKSVSGWQNQLAQHLFWTGLRPLDLLWVGLASICAFQVGVKVIRGGGPTPEDTFRVTPTGR
jgi:hypothetical protein